jgi:hypothetical protein
MPCEELLTQCGLALIASFGAVVAALVALVKSHDAQQRSKENTASQQFNQDGEKKV